MQMIRDLKIDRFIQDSQQLIVHLLKLSNQVMLITLSRKKKQKKTEPVSKKKNPCLCQKKKCTDFFKILYLINFLCVLYTENKPPPPKNK